MAEGAFRIPTKPKISIGWREYVDLPDLGLEHIPSKIDTGARTSALHVDSIKPFKGADCEQMVRVSFRIRHNPGEKPEKVHRDLPVSGLRKVTSSNGTREDRWVVRTRLSLGGLSRAVNFTLTNRGSMRYPILVGRSAMRSRYEIHPGQSFIHGTRDAEPLVHSADGASGDS
ncbi:RimK/LysX family protein [Pontixanthobacter sp. CEM42]|uniref:ATP-dependent zinc protease family protein n=1 Tax=Pontixanthobacter sp. CEM42 TaxID=2792077 RepID=UPI001ADF09E3|nr:RimK/LysX family protein [Pontixanthobacter sp. CEM42]